MCTKMKVTGFLADVPTATPASRLQSMTAQKQPFAEHAAGVMSAGPCMRETRMQSIQMEVWRAVEGNSERKTAWHSVLAWSQRI